MISERVPISESQSKPLGKYRRWRFRVLVVLCVLVAAELLLRVFGFGNPILVAPNAYTNYELLPNQAIRRLWPLSDSWVSNVRTNRFGMRSEEITDAKPVGVLRIYFLGDSYTYGTTQVDQRQIFTSLLQHDLPTRLNQPVQVMNGSISGWAISNELAYLEEHGTLQADLIVLVLNAGDPGQPKAVLIDKIPSTLHHPSLGLEELWFRGLIPAVYRFQASTGVRFLAALGSIEDPGMAASVDRIVIQQNLGYLKQMRDYVVSRGAKFSIVFIGKDADYGTPLAYARTTVGKNAIIGWAKENGVPLADVEAALGGHLGNSVLLGDHAHPNVIGHQRIATEIEQDWSILSSARNSETVAAGRVGSPSENAR